MNNIYECCVYCKMSYGSGVKKDYTIGVRAPTVLKAHAKALKWKNKKEEVEKVLEVRSVAYTLSIDIE